jgi:hypothetical protein
MHVIADAILLLLFLDAPLLPHLIAAPPSLLSGCQTRIHQKCYPSTPN